MGWLWAIVVGLVLGLIAKVIIPGRQMLPLWLTVLCGMGGSLLGNAVSTWIGVNNTKGFDWTRHALQLAGAVLLVAIGDAVWAAHKARKRGATAV